MYNNEDPVQYTQRAELFYIYLHISKSYYFEDGINHGEIITKVDKERRKEGSFEEVKSMQGILYRRRGWIKVSVAKGNWINRKQNPGVAFLKSINNSLPK